MTLRALLHPVVQTLRQAGVSGPERDAQRLLAHALNMPLGKLITCDGVELSADQKKKFQAMITARARRQPVSQIIGHRAFYGRDFKVTPDVLDPRPETECLVHEVLQQNPAHVLDLGTGSGAIGVTIALEQPGTQVTCTDISATALAVAVQNAKRLGAQNIYFVETDWAAKVTGSFDVIVSNPPYLAPSEIDDLDPEVRDFEPHVALLGGQDGLECYRTIMEQSLRLLVCGGWLMLEIGWTQSQQVRQLAEEKGYGNIKIIPDFDDTPRVILAQKA